MGMGMNGGEREKRDEERVVMGKGIERDGNVRKGMCKRECGGECKKGNEEKVLWGRG